MQTLRNNVLEKTHKLVIVGTSAFAEIAYEYFTVDSGYEVVGFSVEHDYLDRQELLGLPVVAFENVQEHFAPASHHIYAAVTYGQLNRLRSRLAQQAKAKGYRLASYVSTRAFVWRNVALGEHCFIFESNTVQPFVHIGDNCVLWSGNHIGHHSRIGEDCFIASHVVISGFTEVGRNSFLGVNCSVANNVKIGRDNWIGPGVSLMKDTADGALFGGTHQEPSRVSSLRYFRVKEAA